MVFDNTGKIIIVRNIVFKDFYEGKINYNHDKHFVRPCLVISELEDKRYVLPITSTGRNEKFLYKKFKIYRDNLINQSLSTKIYKIRSNHPYRTILQRTSRWIKYRYLL